MLFQEVLMLAILGYAFAIEAASIPEFDGLGELGMIRRQSHGNKFGDGQHFGSGQNIGGNNAAKAKKATKTTTAAASAAAKTSAAATEDDDFAASGSSCLDTENIQAGSESTGQETPAAGQASSATDANNFINFCSGQTTTNGLQVKAGSCNGIVMGKIPSTSNMVSAIITSPKPGEDLPAGKSFTVSVQTIGLAAGSFTNAAATYYSAPQDLDSQGQVIGHTHLTIQDLGNSLQPTSAPDPVSFVFFKGVNDAGDGNGLLSATVTDGLPAGNYRVCSMTSSSNHQPVLMPVAQRGAQDDCQKFTVGAGNDNDETTAKATTTKATTTNPAGRKKGANG
ncbi:ribosomal protein s17 [Diplocarpon rosae]|nr:ribosomal protein s17 [Diplocarpon rosae]